MTLNINYDKTNKNEIRKKLIDIIRTKDIKNILTLESPQFLFSKLLPDKKIIVFEEEANTIQKMRKSCPKNVELVFGNITKFEIFNSKVDCIYLDFCGTWLSEEVNIIKLKESLKNTKLFALTICLRNVKGYSRTNSKKGYKNELITSEFNGDYQFDLINKLQEITNINWKVLYGESYYDSMQMVTLILENK